MEKLSEKLRTNIFFVAILFVGLACQLNYVHTVCANVPLMDYWKYINMFVEKIFSGEIGWVDIWQNDGIHRSPIQFIYFILNVIFFDMDSRVEIYFGSILMAGTIIFLYKNLLKDVAIQSQKILSAFGASALVVIVYNLNQYEILSEQFALSFATRNLLFIVSFILTSRFLINKKNIKNKKTILLGLLYIFVIIGVGSGFFPAYVATIAFVILFDLCVCKERKQYIEKYAILFGALVIGTFIYMFGMTGTTSTMNFTDISIYVFIKEFLIGVFTMLGVSIIGFEYNDSFTMCVGIFIFVLYLLSFVLYLKKKYYKETYVPIVLYGYAMGAMGLIYLGRTGMYGSSYAYASRYVCETNIAVISFLWIVLLYMKELSRTQKDRVVLVFKTVIACLSIVVLLVGIGCSDLKEWKIAPYRKIYQENLIESIKNVEDLTTDEFAVFQSEESIVRSGIEIMEKYKLGIFSE